MTILPHSELSTVNEQLKRTYDELQLSDKMKEEYLTRYLNRCRDYIDRIDNDRRSAYRMLKDHQTDELMKHLKSDARTKAEQEHFFEDFDAAFLAIFPDFIRSFNALLRPGEEILPKAENRLSDWSWEANFEPLRPYLVDFMFKTIALGLPEFTCLNVNFPKAEKFKGIKICRMAHSRWQNEVEHRTHPFGGDYYWLVGDCKELEPEATDTDRWALFNGYIAVTPTQLDVTAKELIDVLKEVL